MWRGCVPRPGTEILAVFHFLAWAALIAAALGAILLFLPLRFTLVIGWDRRFPLFDVRIWRFSLRTSRPPHWLRRVGERLLDFVVGKISRPKTPPLKPVPAKRSLGRKIHPPTFVRAVLEAGLRFLARFTRRLEIQLGGIDPASLGMLTGFCGGLATAFGVRKFRWVPDFGSASFRFRLEWTLSISLFGLLLWAGRSVPAIAGSFRRNRTKGLLPSAM